MSAARRPISVFSCPRGTSSDSIECASITCSLSDMRLIGRTIHSSTAAATADTTTSSCRPSSSATKAPLSFTRVLTISGSGSMISSPTICAASKGEAIALLMRPFVASRSRSAPSPFFLRSARISEPPTIVAPNTSLLRARPFTTSSASAGSLVKQAIWAVLSTVVISSRMRWETPCW